MAPTEDTIAANWRCFLACGIIVLSPFQYGVDFGLIGGLQAMTGFLQVREGRQCLERGLPPPGTPTRTRS